MIDFNTLYGRNGKLYTDVWKIVYDEKNIDYKLYRLRLDSIIGKITPTTIIRFENFDPECWRNPKTRYYYVNYNEIEQYAHYFFYDEDRYEAKAEIERLINIRKQNEIKYLSPLGISIRKLADQSYIFCDSDNINKRYITGLKISKDCFINIKKKHNGTGCQIDENQHYMDFKTLEDAINAIKDIETFTLLQENVEKELKTAESTKFASDGLFIDFSPSSNLYYIQIRKEIYGIAYYLIKEWKIHLNKFKACIRKFNGHYLYWNYKHTGQVEISFNSLENAISFLDELESLILMNKLKADVI